MLKVPIALVAETGELIHISEYSQSEHMGELRCPGCKGIVVPKAISSNKKTAHFAHQTLDVCHGYESALHEWAKNQFPHLIGERFALPSIMESVLGKSKLKELRRRAENRFIRFRESVEPILKERRIRLGGWHLKDYCKDFKSVDEWIRDEFVRFVGRPAEELERAHEIWIESAQVEVPVDDGTVVADVILNGRYNVEIFVTHRVDEIKESFLREIGLDTVEIDLPRDQRILFDKDKILHQMLREVSNKNVFGYFEDVSGDRFGISLINITTFYRVIEDKAEAMIKEDYERVAAGKDADQLRLSQVLGRIEAEPGTFFLDYIFAQSLCFKESDYWMRGEVEASLLSKGFPLYQPGGKRKYAYDSPGIITAVLSVEPYNRVKVRVHVVAHFDDLNIDYRFPTVILKSDHEEIIGSMVGRRFISVRSGWYGAEFEFE